VIAFLAVTVLPATALAQPHWRRGEETQVTVYVERTRVGATNWSYVKRAGAQAGWATLNYDPRTNTAWYGTLHLNPRYLTAAAAQPSPAVSATSPAARMP
jgi:hypothetical protein